MLPSLLLTGMVRGADVRGQFDPGGGETLACFGPESNGRALFVHRGQRDLVLLPELPQGCLTQTTALLVVGDFKFADVHPVIQRADAVANPADFLPFLLDGSNYVQSWENEVSAS
jgi:hypothetical protein